MSNEKDFGLVRQFLEGDESAFNFIVKNYREQIYWQARRMLGNHPDADEITQEVFIVLYNKLNTFKFNSALSTWIYSITSTRSINLIRKKKVRSFIGIDDVQARNLKRDEDIVKNFEDREKLADLENKLQQLPSRQREVFILRQFDGLSYDEIAQITGKSVGGLKANYFHAIKKITEHGNEE